MEQGLAELEVILRNRICVVRSSREGRRELRAGQPRELRPVPHPPPRLDAAMAMVEDAFRTSSIGDLLAEPSRSKPLCRIAVVS